MSAESKQVAPYGLRMAPELKERVAASADRNSRSMNTEINHALELYLSGELTRQNGKAAERKRLAELAMQALLSAHPDNPLTPERLAQGCYAVADAMIAAEGGEE